MQQTIFKTQKTVRQAQLEEIQEDPGMPNQANTTILRMTDETNIAGEDELGVLKL